MNHSSPSSRPGMGALPHENGTSFRVWAPHASRVAVAGTFNHWSEDTHPLAHEANGYWSADVPGARVGHTYQFVITNADSGHVFWRIDPYAREVTHSAGDGVIASPDFDWGGLSGYRTPDWNQCVIYELHVGTFNDDPGGGPGNLDRAIERLGYLGDLGINAIKIMPLTEFATDFSWGYNPAHIFAVESIYGGPRAFKQFVRAAHDHGIAVIADVVYNHFGPSDLDLWRFDGWNQHGKGGIYFYNDRRSRTPWGDTRPDYGRPEVRQFLRDNAMMWLDEYRVDGLRWDSTVNIRTQYNGQGGDIGDGWNLMRRINDEVGRRWPWKISIAEDLQSNEWLTRNGGDGGAGFHAQWAADFVHPVRRALITGDDNRRDMYSIRDAIYARYNGDAFERVIYTESHDEVANGHARLPEEIWPGNASGWYAAKRSTLGAALVFTSPGLPMIFQGQELLEDEWFRDVDPIDWHKLQSNAGIHRLYRDLIRLRRNWHNHTAGLRGQQVNVFHVNNRDKVVAMHRWENGGRGDDVMVVLNFSARSFPEYRLGFPQGGTWRVRFNSDWSGYRSDFGSHPGHDTEAFHGARDGMGYQGSLGIGPYTALILS
ncbi:MAG: alpha-amylase family glycosyl hydrolase, partial [Pseudomonadota bacterium]